MIYRTAGGAHRELRWFDARGQALGPLGEPDDYLINPRLSPDGARALVFRTVEGNSDVWLIDEVRASRMTVATATDQFPIWSPDGNRIVFRSNRTGAFDLFVAPASSPGSERPLVETNRDKVANDWSRDGRYLSFQQNDPTTGWNLWAMPLDGSGKPFVVLETPFDERGANFSPDGRWLAYHSNQSGRYEVYVRPFVVSDSPTAAPNVQQWQVSAGGGVFSKWRDDGRLLYYQSLDGWITAVPVTVSAERVQPGAPAAIVRPGFFGAASDINLGRQWDVAPNGRFLVNAVLDVASSLVLIQHWKPPAPR
jgi:Tol biopolymer transport system component